MHRLPAVKAKRFTSAFITMILCSALFATPRMFASQLDDLNTTLDNLGTSVDSTTATEQESGSIILQTNATQCGILVGSIMTAHAGDTIAYNIGWIPGPSKIAALQADVMLSSGVTVLSMTAGPAATAAGKTVSFSGNPNNPVIVFGLNQTPIGDGNIVIATLKLDPSIGPGLYPVVFSNPVASDPLGSAKPMCVTSGLLEVN